MRLAILPATTDYPLILGSRDSGVSKDAGPEQRPGPRWFETRASHAPHHEDRQTKRPTGGL